MDRYETVLIEMVQTVDLPMLEDIQVNVIDNITLYSIIYRDDNQTEFETTKTHINRLVDLINSNDTINISLSRKSIPIWRYQKIN